MLVIFSLKPTETSDVLAALEFVANHTVSRNRPSVVSMSLGGPCSTPRCAGDPIVRAVELLATMGIAVSVAAGNDGANACYGSPNSASSAIVSGAFDSEDSVTYWSNVGQCVNIFSPGQDIISACAKTLCPDGKGKEYVTMSGTSMACPHTTGVLAQLLEKDPSASPDELVQALTCEASRSQLTFDSIDTISRNLLLQTPRPSNTFSSCGLGDGCPASCNDKGFCAPPRVGDNYTICHCDKGLDGSTCTGRSNSCRVKTTDLKMADDGAGGGWNFAKFAIVDANGLVVENALDSMQQGEASVDSRQYCLDLGSYSIYVTRGLNPSTVLWQLCEFVGGAPFRGDFVVEKGGKCSFICQGIPVDLKLNSKSGTGWHDAYYAIYSEFSGVQILGGTLTSDESMSQSICLQNECYLLYLERQGDSPNDISFEACGVKGSRYDVIRICIDSSGACAASLVSAPNNEKCASSNASQVVFNMFSPSLNGWGDNSFELSDASHDLSVKWSNNPGFFSISSLCLNDGCYKYVVGGDNSSLYDEIFWLTCGLRGHSPWNTQLCVDHAYNLCYGLTGCPVLKSYARTHNKQWYVIYDDSGQLHAVDNLHSIHELCELADGCYNAFIGAGITYDPTVFNSVELCGVEMTMRSSARICIKGSIYSHQAYGKQITSCEVHPDTSNSCTHSREGDSLNAIIMVSKTGNGWGKVRYNVESESGAILYSGTLLSGAIGVDENCYAPGKCYYISTTSDPEMESAVLFVMCGLVGGAPLDRVKFCVTDTGCMFDLSSKGGGGSGPPNGSGYGYGSNYGSSYSGSAYYSTDEGSDASDDTFAADDDFPPQPGTPTSRPSLDSESSQYPPSSPDGLIQVADSLYNMTLAISSVEPMEMLTAEDLIFVSLAFRRALELADIEVWNVLSSLSFAEKIYSEQHQKRMQQLYYERVLNVQITISLIIGQVGVGGAVETARHSLQVTFSSGLLEQLLSQALNFLVSNPSSSGISLNKVRHVKPISLSFMSTSVPMLKPKDSAPSVSGVYSSMWKVNDSNNGHPQSTVFIILITVSATVSIIVCLLIVYCYFNRRRIKYDKVRIIDLEDDAEQQEMDISSKNGKNGIVGFARKFGERRDKRDSEVVTFAFNNQSIEEEMPQAVL